MGSIPTVSTLGPPTGVQSRVPGAFCAGDQAPVAMPVGCLAEGGVILLLEGDRDGTG